MNAERVRGLGMADRGWLVAVGSVVAPVVLAVAGASVLFVAGGDPPPPPPPVPGPATSAVRPSGVGQEAGSLPVKDTDDRVDGPLLAESEPVRLRIAAIGVDTRVVRLGLDGGGAMEVPGDPADAGWYTGGPAPGALGPAVIAAHVTWDRVPAAFFRLGELRSGDRIKVLREDGVTAVFEVSRVTVVAKSRFPTSEVFGPTDHAALRLITCAGRYDEERARYDDNAVVMAALVAVRRPAVSGR